MDNQENMYLETHMKVFEIRKRKRGDFLASQKRRPEKKCTAWEEMDDPEVK